MNRFARLSTESYRLPAGHLRRGLLSLALLAVLMLPASAAAQATSLNLVGVGINRYRTPGMNLTYAVPDAQQVAQLMNANRLFGGSKSVNLLLNEQATKRNIEGALATLERRASANTYSVLYLSGHGTRDGRGHFLYPTHEFDPRNAAATSIQGETLLARLKRMPGRVFLIIDACHSGSAGFTNVWITPASSNRLTIISSSLSREYSLELPNQKNGAFTQAFLEALGGAADANKNGTVTLQEMHNYMYTRIGQLTQGKQHMKTFVPSVAQGASIPIASIPGAVSGANVYRGRETLPGFGPLSFALESNGRVTMTDAKGRTTGTWTRQGNVITMQFSGGRVVYQGRMNGTTFSGTARNDRTQWNFSVSRG